LFEIRKQFSFSASHILKGLPEGHPCGRLHGHNYVIELVLRSESLDAVGFVRDYRALESFKRWVDDVLDHRHLNDSFPAAGNPTAERLAKEIFMLWKLQIPELCRVRVSETPKTWADYADA
jgi:6-pyruvoyltetrahydropterin/6-carboxytetrahydropterin synthase